jgi:hypothetical protein
VNSEVFFRVAGVDLPRCGPQNDCMRRALTMAYCIASLLAWLMYEPFFHAHAAEDGGELHAHFDVEEHHDEEEGHEHSGAPEFDPPVRAHHGVETSAFAGENPPSPALFIEVGETLCLIDPPVLQGSVVEQPVRVHDPPSRVASSPRSPPA